MEIIHHPPSERLSQYVVSLLEIKNHASEEIYFNMIPRAYPAFIFTSPEKDAVGNLMTGIVSNYHPGKIYFGGLGMGFVQILVPKEAHFIVALLPPYSTGLFFKEDACKYTETLFCVSDEDEKFKAFNQHLWEHTEKRFLIPVIEQFLLCRVQKIMPCSYTTHAIEIINKRFGCISVKNLAGETYTCERNLRRKFEQHIGLSPKEYINVIRFNSFVKDVFYKKINALMTLQWTTIITISPIFIKIFSVLPMMVRLNF